MKQCVNAGTLSSRAAAAQAHRIHGRDFGGRGAEYICAGDYTAASSSRATISRPGCDPLPASHEYSHSPVVEVDVSVSSQDEVEMRANPPSLPPACHQVGTNPGPAHIWRSSSLQPDVPWRASLQLQMQSLTDHSDIYGIFRSSIPPSDIPRRVSLQSRHAAAGAPAARSAGARTPWLPWQVRVRE
jgi:hypothetical protein